MEVIYKYQFTISEQFEISMPRDAKILSVEIQPAPNDFGPGIPCLWAIVDKTKPLEHRFFNVVPTDRELAKIPVHAYIGTIRDGEFVWHIFDVSKLND